MHKKDVAKKYTIIIVDLFKKINKQPVIIQEIVHYALIKLIRLHFIDDENKTRELLTMVNESLSAGIKNDMSLLDITYIKLEEKENQLKEQTNQLKEKDNRLEEQKIEINKLKENNISY